MRLQCLAMSCLAADANGPIREQSVLHRTVPEHMLETRTRCSFGSSRTARLQDQPSLRYFLINIIINTDPVREVANKMNLSLTTRILRS